MRDIDLYRQVLGLEKPWTVERVDLDVAGHRVDIWVEHESGTVWSCPQCERELSCRDHAEERVWRHLDTCQFQTHLHARIPRVDCPEHGVVQVRVPWAEVRSRFTLLMERLVIDVLTQCSTVSGACRLLGLSWDEAWGVMERAVARGQRRKQAKVIPRLGVDEKAFRKGHDYMTVVCDLDGASVEYGAEDRTTESLEGYWKGLTEAQLEGIESVSMDMWPAYIGATLSQVPGAQDKIVFDRFHIMQHMNAAVDTVRKQEHKELLARKDDTLKGTLHVWRYARENLPERHRARFAWLTPPEPQGGPRLSYQGEPARTVGLHLPGLGETLLREVVLVGNAFTVGTGAGGGASAQAPSAQHSDLLQTAGYQRGGWVGYFGIQEFKCLFRDLDAWIRSRLRSTQHPGACEQRQRSVSSSASG